MLSVFCSFFFFAIVLGKLNHSYQIGKWVACIVRQPVRCQIGGEKKKRCALLMHRNSDNECTFLLLPSARAPTPLLSLRNTRRTEERMLSVTSAGYADGCWFKILKFANGPRSTS